jgi:hypothetical protein
LAISTTRIVGAAAWATTADRAMAANSEREVMVFFMSRVWRIR